MNTNQKLSLAFFIAAAFIFFAANSSFGAPEWTWPQAAGQKAKSSEGDANPSSAVALKSSQEVPQTASVAAAVKENAPAPSGPNSFTINAPQRNANYEEAVKLQAKLNDLLRVTAEMDRFNRSKVAAVQSMVDKARANQKILRLLATPGDAAAKIRKADADQILLSKKVRGMREEAEKQIALAQSHQESVLPAGRKES